MADTYTPNLGLTKPCIRKNWAEAVNENFEKLGALHYYHTDGWMFICKNAVCNEGEWTQPDTNLQSSVIALGNDGSFTLQTCPAGNSTIYSWTQIASFGSDGSLTLSSGSTIGSDGSLTLSNGTTIGNDGSLTLPGGTTISGSASIGGGLTVTDMINGSINWGNILFPDGYINAQNLEIKNQKFNRSVKCQSSSTQRKTLSVSADSGSSEQEVSSTSATIDLGIPSNYATDSTIKLVLSGACDLYLNHVAANLLPAATVKLYINDSLACTWSDTSTLSYTLTVTQGQTYNMYIVCTSGYGTDYNGNYGMVIRSYVTGGYLSCTDYEVMADPTEVDW